MQCQGELIDQRAVAITSWMLQQCAGTRNTYAVCEAHVRCVRRRLPVFFSILITSRLSRITLCTVLTVQSGVSATHGE